MELTVVKQGRSYGDAVKRSLKFRHATMRKKVAEIDASGGRYKSEWHPRIRPSIIKSIGLPALTQKRSRRR